MVSLIKTLHCKLFQNLPAQSSICFMFSEKEELRYKTSRKSKSIQKCNGFVTIGCVVFTSFTEKLAPFINLINNNASVMMLIVAVRLPKTK